MEWGIISVCVCACACACVWVWMVETVLVPVSVHSVCIDDLRGAVTLLEGGQNLLRGMM